MAKNCGFHYSSYLHPISPLVLSQPQTALPIIGQDCILQTSRHPSLASAATLTASATAASTSASAASFLPQGAIDSSDVHDSYNRSHGNGPHGARICGINEEDSDIRNQDSCQKFFPFYSLNLVLEVPAQVLHAILQQNPLGTNDLIKELCETRT